MVAISQVPLGSSDSLTVIYPPTLLGWHLPHRRLYCWHPDVQPHPPPPPTPSLQKRAPPLPTSMLAKSPLSSTPLAFSSGAAEEEKGWKSRNEESDRPKGNFKLSLSARVRDRL